MTLSRATLPPAERKKLEAADAKRQQQIIKACQTARAATAALHDAVGRGDQHSKGMAATLAHLAETVTTVIEARELKADMPAKPKRKAA
jgi:hypothetical protein